MSVVISSFLLCVLSLIISSSTQQLVVRNIDLEVANGRVGYLQDNLLSFNAQPWQVCKIEVVQNEPIHQRVGVLTPKVFDCYFLPNSVKYEHNGSPLLNEDTIKMRAYIFLQNQTFQETFIYKIKIVNSGCDIIQTSNQDLYVPAGDKFSNPIDVGIVQFHYDRQFDNKCQIIIDRSHQWGFPIAGWLIRTQKLYKENIIENEVIYMDCDEFLLKGFRYALLSEIDSPNIDYLPIHVIVSDSQSKSVLTEERHWFPIHLITKLPNLSPILTSHIRSFEVDEYILTNFLPDVISASDAETTKRHLIFNVTVKPRKGFVTHLQDETQQVDSFWQKDVNEMKIGYQPSNISYSERQIYDIEMIALDSFYKPSNPFVVSVIVRVTNTNAPRVSWNMGLTLLEGQCRPITDDVLRIVDRDNLSEVTVTISGGLQHGNLFVNGKPGYTFTCSDINQGIVSYCHDDSDTRKDAIFFHVSDISYSTRFKFPIKIFPKDDHPPFLVSNLILLPKEDELFLINRQSLEASDSDSDSNYIKFNITKQPTAGEIQKKRSWEKVGWKINSFYQSDLFQGLIYYKHNGEETFEDFVEFNLIDSNKPEANVSPTQRIDIKILPVDDLPPGSGPGNALSLIVNETDIFILTPQQLNFFDRENPANDVIFHVTEEFEDVNDKAVDNDAGKLISLINIPMPMKDPSLVELRNFSQKLVNYSKVAYMPPISDVGLHPRQIQFTFSVSAASGLEVTDQRFFITILPVDNQRPSIDLLPLTILEGDKITIPPDILYISDFDTAFEDLTIVLSQLPKHGVITLNGRNLQLNDTFTPADVEKLRLQYEHDGSETMNDQLMLVVTDGHQNSSAFLNILIETIDDEVPVIIGGKKVLEIAEGATVALTTEYLSASDLDTPDNFLVFDILEYPMHGNILIDDNPTLRFTQQDIVDGKVLYKQNQEVGRDLCEDRFTVMVSDRKLYTTTNNSLDFQTKTIYIEISPVDNSVPNILISEEILQCDEGDEVMITNEYLRAEDEDTSTSDLIFNIISGPKYGFIEDRTPRKGYEKIIAKKATSFSYEQLISNYIFYIQSNHSGIEPVSDRFSFYVTDGKHKSLENFLLISILPQNDEEPEVRCSNLTCVEGSFQPIQISVEDLDSPNVMITIQTPPYHGIIINEMQMSERIKRSRDHQSEGHDLINPINQFSMEELNKQVHPAYMHDGSESEEDQFEMKISDGKFERVMRFMINITKVNDEKPELLINEILLIEMGTSKIISNLFLHAEDMDSAAEDIKYIINVCPRRGRLLIQERDESWKRLDVADSFTEFDVQMNRLKYEHYGDLGSKSQDSFSFHLSDGRLSSRKQTFSIYIENTKKKHLQVVTNLLRVYQHQQVVITTDILTAFDDDEKRIDDIIYHVTIPPSLGNLENLLSPNISIVTFTQLNLLAGKVVYVHKKASGEKKDFFLVSVTNGLKTNEAYVEVDIIPVDIYLPVVSFTERWFIEKDKISTIVYKGSTLVIDNHSINVTDVDTINEKIFFNIIELPKYGMLLLNGREYLKQDLLTYTDLLSQRLIYKHRDDNSFIDHFSFTVSDGSNVGYIYNGKSLKIPLTCYLYIEDLDKTPPHIEVCREAYSIKPFKKRKSLKYHFISIDRNYLRASDETTKDAEKIRFNVIQDPIHGILKSRLKTRKEKTSLKLFTQDNLNKGQLIYIVTERVHATNDSFLFSVEDEFGNQQTPQRFFLSWSKLSINTTKVQICEGSKLVIGLSRIGNLKVSSFISVSIISKIGRSKHHPTNHLDNFSRQVQFDPGVSKQTWQLSFPKDNVESLRKNLKIRFSKFVNSLFVSRRKFCKVLLLDENHRRCSNVKRKSKISKLRKMRRKKMKKARKNKLMKKRKLFRKQGPSSYFNNGTDHFWAFNSISSLGIGDRDSNISNLPESSINSTLYNDQATPGSLVKINNQSPTDKCVSTKRGIIIYDSAIHRLVQCDGNRWVAWQPRHVSGLNVQCEEGWVAFSGRCLYISEEKDENGKSWNLASRVCRESYSASLVSIKNRKELKQLWRLVGRYPFWLGLNRKLDQNKWRWINNDKLSFLHWKINFPRPEDQCSFVGQRKMWKSIPCDRKSRKKIKLVCIK